MTHAAVTIQITPQSVPSPPSWLGEVAVFAQVLSHTGTLKTIQEEDILTRARRAHWRLSRKQRLARNARPSNAPRLSVTLHGLPTTFARAFGFDLLATA